MNAWDAMKLDRWLAGLVSAGCEHCHRAAGQWCDAMAGPAVEMVRVVQDPPRVVCSARMTAAVAGHRVSRVMTVAQFGGGPLPAGLAAV